MFGFFRKKAMKAFAVKIYQELILDSIKGDNYFGRTADEISSTIGLDVIAVYGLMNKLIEHELIEELDGEKLTYKAVNIHSIILAATSSNEVFSFSKKSVDRVNFSGV